MYRTLLSLERSQSLQRPKLQLLRIRQLHQPPRHLPPIQPLPNNNHLPLRKSDHPASDLAKLSPSSKRTPRPDNPVVHRSGTASNCLRTTLRSTLPLPTTNHNHHRVNKHLQRSQAPMTMLSLNDPALSSLQMRFLPRPAHHNQHNSKEAPIRSSLPNTIHTSHLLLGRTIRWEGLGRPCR